MTEPPANRSVILYDGWVEHGRQHVPIALILTLSTVLNTVGITWGLPNYFDWAADSIAPFDFLHAAYRRFSGGWADLYPPLAYAILAVLCAPLFGYLLWSGGLKAPTAVFPFGLTDPISTLSQIIIISRLLSAVMGVGIVLLVYLTVQRLFDRRSALFSALIVALYYPLIYYAHNANVDVPYLFWALLAIYFFVRLMQEGLLKQYVLFAFFGTLAICTKDQAYALFLLSPLAILWIRATEASTTAGQQVTWRDVLWDKRLIWAAVVTIVTFAIAHNLLFNFSGFLNHVRLITGGGSIPYADYPPTFWGRLQLLEETTWQLAAGLTPPIFVLCVAGCFYCACKFPRYTLPVLLLGLSYYVGFINVVRYVPIRFVLPIGIILAFFGGKLIADLLQAGRWQRLRRLTACLVFGYSALYAIQLDLLLLNDPRYAAEQWLSRNVAQGSVIETFAPRDTSFKYLPRFPPWIKVRASKIEEGTQWVIRETKADRKALLNLYGGREAADYVVFSKLWYRALLTPASQDSKQTRVLNDFFQGRTNYELAATFETPTFVPVVGLLINPKIDIFKKRDTTNTALAP